MRERNHDLYLVVSKHIVIDTHSVELILENLGRRMELIWT